MIMVKLATPQKEKAGSVCSRSVGVSVSFSVLSSGCDDILTTACLLERMCRRDDGLWEIAVVIPVRMPESGAGVRKASMMEGLWGVSEKDDGRTQGT